MAYKRPQNIRDKLIRSKIPQASRVPKRKVLCMKKCQIEVNSSVDCSTRNVIYLLGCSKCPMQYIGETERMLKDRFSEHKGYFNTKNQSKTTGIHFNQKGHSVSNMQISKIEKVYNQDNQFRKQRVSA